ncbi:Endopolyphosphatase, partial [Linderina macrospora]
MVLGITGLAALAIVALGFIALFDNTGDRPPNSETQLNSSSVGRFLHITDLHVDPYYRTGSTTYSSCHRKPPSSSKHARRHGSRSLNGNSDDGIADAGGKEWKRFDRDGHDHTGIFGIPEAKCDSPVALVNATAEYLRTQWADRLDFVIWTGDSGRHDNDAEIPRTFEEIIEQNHITAGAMRYAFPAIPVVPNIGNNDISPHNELARPGHKRARLTYRQLSKAWHGFIPDDQMRTFLYGGYFAKDVVDYGDSVPDDDGQLGSSPPKAAEPTHVTAAGMKKPKKAPKKQKPVRKPRGITVLSLNTIYWYRANAKVGGCAADDSPGLAQLAWIRYQMRRARQRNRDLILMGHVIPNRDNYRPTCYHGYARTVTQVIPAPALGATGGLMRKSSGSSDDDEYDLPL